MRFVFLTSLMVLVAGCRCSPATPTAVTLRVKNGSADPIFLEDTRGQLGLTVQRKVGDSWFGFDDQPCECRTCERICETACTCPDAGTEAFIQRVAPGDTAERTWNGVVQVSGSTPCRSGTTPCLEQENAPLNETFRAELCYAVQVSGFSPEDGGRGVGEFPNVGVSCVTKDFQPQDGVAEVGPERGAACTTTAECKGKDELCLGGACTTGCPANDFPALGSNWALRVASPDDSGFFTTTPLSMAGGTLYTGTGTIASVLYQGTTLVIRLSRRGAANELLNGALYVTLPPGLSAPLVSGGSVSVKLFDASSKDNYDNRALVLRDATTGAVLLAADAAQKGRLLSDAELAPFAVAFGQTPIGCSSDACGRMLFTATRFTTGADAVEVEPGKSARLSTTAGTYRLLNVTAGHYATTRCSLAEVRPFALWREAP